MSLPREATTTQHIAARWRIWLPWATIEARHTSMRENVDVDAALEAMRETHSRACRQALDAGITWKRIRATDLDDPRLSSEERNKLILRVQARRRNQMKVQIEAIERRMNSRCPQ